MTSYVTDVIQVIDIYPEAIIVAKNTFIVLDLITVYSMCNLLCRPKHSIQFILLTWLSITLFNHRFIQTLKIITEICT